MAFRPQYNHLPAHIPPFQSARPDHHSRFFVPGHVSRRRRQLRYNNIDHPLHKDHMMFGNPEDRPDLSCSSDWYSSDSYDSDDEWYDDGYDHERTCFTTKTNFGPARGHTRWDGQPPRGDFVNHRPRYHGDPLARGPNLVVPDAFADGRWPGANVWRDRAWDDRVGATRRARAMEQHRGDMRREGRVGAFTRGEDRILDHVGGVRTKELVVHIPAAAPRPHISQDQVLLLPDLLRVTVHLVSNWHGRHQLVERHPTLFGEVVRGRLPRAIPPTAMMEAAIPCSMTREEILEALGHSNTSWRVFLDARGRTMGEGKIGRFELMRGERIGKLCVEIGLGSERKTENRRATRPSSRLNVWVVRKVSN